MDLRNFWRRLTSFFARKNPPLHPRGMIDRLEERRLLSVTFDTIDAQYIA